MDYWISCNRCCYAEQLSDGSYYCTYRRYFESEYSGCYDGMYGYPCLANQDTEILYEDWLSYKTKTNYTNPPSLLQIICDWLSSKRSTSNDKKEEP